MSNFKDRLKTEEKSLKDKVEKLDKFISSDNFHSINSLQKILLPIQLGVMKIYLNILSVRIEDLGK